MKELLSEWQKKFSEKIKESFGIEILKEKILIDFPQKVEFGDATTNVAFAVAKALSKNPVEVAKSLSTIKLKNVRKIEAKGPYINLFLDRKRAFNYIFSQGNFAERSEKIIVEHTNINPNKAAHIGHLRNAILGDTLVRSLRFLGNRVEVQNYIDDTGVQVADVTVGFERMLNSDFERVKEEAEKETPFDVICWNVYAKTQNWYEENPENLRFRYETLNLIEKGNSQTAAIAEFIANKMVICHLRTMLKLNIKYDLLPFESDVLNRGFFEECFSLLKEKNCIEKVPFECEDKLKGCWVMRLKENKEFEGLTEADKVIVRSNGTVTYLGKDLAYQMWKLGILNKNFSYKIFENAPYKIFRTSSENGENIKAGFGGASRVYNVIDVRQSYLQKVIKEALKLLGFEKESASSIHFSYEMVALSTNFVKEEIEKGKIPAIDENDLKKPFVEMSGRKGLGFIADDLIIALIECAKKEILEREKELSSQELNERAEQIASAALKYYILKFGRNQVVAFDLNKAVSFEGETGPYIQYAVVRAENILRKAKERGEGIPEISEENIERYFDFLDQEGWGIISFLIRFPFIVEKAVSSLELNIIAKYLFEMAQMFQNYYHISPVLQEGDENKRKAKLLFVSIFSQRFKKILNDIVGIDVPQRM